MQKSFGTLLAVVAGIAGALLFLLAYASYQRADVAAPEAQAVETPATPASVEDEANVTHEVSSASEGEDLQQATDASVEVNDDSDIPKLVGMARAQRELALSSKAIIDMACHTDPDASFQVLRNARGAIGEWQSMHANDEAKDERGQCLQALSDVSAMATNCTAQTYSTIWAEHDARWYRRDMQDCQELLRHPPRSP